MKLTIEMVREKDCKHSVRYASVDPAAAVATVYVMRTAAETMPAKITVTVESKE